jgi:hypothetical protein
MSEKIYCGNAKEIETKFGKMLKISFSKDDLAKLSQSLNAQGWVNCNVKEKQTKVQGKSTHYLEIDTYVKPTDTRSQVSETETKSDDLPF